METEKYSYGPLKAIINERHSGKKCVREREMELKNGRVLLSAFDLAVEGIQGLSRRQEVMYHYSLEQTSKY